MSRPAERRPPMPQRAGTAHVDWVRERLSERDWAILESLDRLRVLTGDHLERLHFSSLTGRSGEVVRGRVLRRLVNWRVIVPMGRRIGGGRRGSSRTIYALDTTGQRLMQERQAGEQPTMDRVRRPTIPGDRFLAHSLAVSELYVVLVERTPATGIELAAFEAEPASWWPDGLRGWLKPDAYVRLATAAYQDHWWVEIDRATESLPTIQRKLNAYLDFYQRGQPGPNGVMPRVLLSTISAPRRDAIRALVEKLLVPADELFAVTLALDAWLALLGNFKE